MSLLTVPLTPRFTSNGVPCHRPELDLKIRTARGAHASERKVRFIVDSGSDVTLIPVHVAKTYQIEFDESKHSTRPVRTLGGSLDGFDGFVHVQLLGRWYRWPCFFFLPFTETYGPSSEHPGQSGSRQHQQPPSSLSEWMQRTFRAPGRPKDSVRKKSARLLLGRAGFLASFCIAIRDGHLTISNS
jgi:hypothetical protein